MGYPFRYYGRRPEDWFEGANLGHLYELAFRVPPEADTRAALARVFEETLLEGAAEPSPEPWHWSGAWARCFVGQRFGPATMTFSRITDVLLAMHAIAPLTQVLFWGARTRGTSAWDVWTLAVQPQPDPGPPHPGLVQLGAYRREVDPALALPASDAVFEATRVDARLAAQRRRTAWTSSAAVSAGEIGLVPIERAQPVPRVLPASVTARLAPEDRVFDEPCARVVAQVQGPDGQYTGIAFFDDAGERQRLVLPPWLGAIQAASVRRDGTGVLVAGKDALLEADLPSGTVHRRWSCVRWQDGAISGATYGPDDELVVLTDKALLLLRREGELAETLQRVAGRGFFVAATLLGGAVVIARLFDRALLVAGIAAGRMKALARIKSEAFGVCVQDDGRIVVSAPEGDYELVNVAAAFEAFAAPQRARAAVKAVRAANAPAAPELALEAIAPTALPPAPAQLAPDAAEQRLFGDGAQVVRAQNGTLVALIRDPATHRGDVGAWAWQDAAGAVHTSPLIEYGLKSLAVNATGTLAVALSASSLYALNPSDGAYRRAWRERWDPEDGNLVGLRLLPDDRVLVLTARNVRLLALTDAEATVLATVKVTRPWGVVACMDDRVFVIGAQGTDTVHVLGRVGDAMAVMAKFRRPISAIDAMGDRAFVYDAQKQPLEIAHLGEVYARLEAKLARRKKPAH